MKIKKGVDLSILQPQMVLAAMVVETAFQGYECTITSGCEHVEHRLPHSKHYTGNALDFRLRNVPNNVARNLILIRAKDALPDDFDLVMSGKNAPCLHVEFDPK